MKTPLVEEIRREIRESGPMTFARFMELTLYHPRWGYYNSDREVIGREGDYYTSSDFQGLFGYTLARYVHRLLPPGEPLTFLELGAGKGYFALDFLDYLEGHAPDRYAQTRYLILERSEKMRERQRQVLERHHNRVTWVEEIPEISGVVFSNELFDALPFHRVIYENGTFLELCVGLDESETLTFIKQPPRDPELIAYLEKFDPAWLQPEHVLDLSPEGIRLMAKIGERLQRGWVITVDYGDERKALVDRFPEGSLTCYRNHRVFYDPLQDIGDRDITAFVDFTALIEAGREKGLRVESFTDQGNFLIQAGIAEVYDEIRARSGELEALKAALAMKSLVLDFGRNHRVLILRKEAA